MKKPNITNQITPCCGLPFSTVYWWVSNLTLNSQADREFILNHISQAGCLSVDAWKTLINSGTLETDATLTKAEYLAWFECKRQPSCDQFKTLIEAYKLGNYNPADDYGVGWTEVYVFENYNDKVIKKITDYTGGIGDLPDELNDRIGLYLGDGILTDNKDLAVDFKGQDGANGTAEIPDWQPQTYTGKALVIKDSSIYELPQGVTAQSTDNPRVSNKWVKISNEDFFLENKISENKNYTFFTETVDNVWYYTKKIPTYIGMTFDYKGFANEPIGEIFDENNTKIGDLPPGNSLSILNEITYVAGNKGFIHFKSANFNGNNFQDSSLSWSKDNVFAEGNALDNIYEKIQNIGAGTQGVGLSNNQPFGDLSFQTKYYLEKESIPQKSLVKTISMYAQDSGVITFAFGIIDQFGVFIERENFSFNIPSTGNQTYNVNRIRRENEYIAIKCPITNGMTWKNNISNTGNIWDSGNGYPNPLVRTLDYDMAWLIDFEIVQDNPLAFADDLQNVEERVSTLENKQLTIFDSVTGNPYTIAVVNGVLTSKSLLFNKIAHIGNSICIHPITSFWWGNWGMAATTRNNDYVHKFLSKYQVINPSATTQALNIATWEQNPSTYNKSNLDSTIQDADLITLSIGENVAFNSNFESEFLSLINYIKGQRPLATILICGQFWENAQKENVIQSVANQLGLPFISFAGTDNANYKNTVNTQVYGDDNQWHLISEGGVTAQGVADHPNDLWFELKASKIMSALGL